MDLGISGRRAAVAAASRGLGFATAAALADEGVHVALCSRNADAIEDAAKRIGHDAVPLAEDVSTTNGARRFVDAARDALGGIDILVTNAGGPPPGDFSSTRVDQYLAALELNCLSVIAMCDAAVPHMREQRWGRVVAIAGDGVTVNSIQPGMHDTERVRQLGNRDLGGIPAGMLGSPEDFGAIAAFVSSEHARYLTGTAIQVDGGAYAGLL